METHAHHLHNAPGRGFKHYIFEFFMLFLAVFCGFLAENIREHYAEMRLEKGYMQSLIQDLNADANDIDYNLKLGAIVTEKLDSLVQLLNEENPDKNCERIYLLAPLAGRIVKVSFEDRTSSQLKNSGNMRLVRNWSLSDSIRSYWTSIKINDEIANRMLDMQSEAGNVAVQIISNKYFERHNPLNPFEVSVKNNPKFIDSDAKLMAQFSNRANARLNVLGNYLLHLSETKEKVRRLITLIKEEYHLK